MFRDRVNHETYTKGVNIMLYSLSRLGRGKYLLLDVLVFAFSLLPMLILFGLFIVSLLQGTVGFVGSAVLVALLCGFFLLGLFLGRKAQQKAAWFYEADGITISEAVRRRKEESEQ